MSTDTAHDMGHLDRVWQNVQCIADGQANMRVLVAASYLHDLVNLPKDHPERHLSSRLSADAAVPILEDLSFSDIETEAVQHAIVAHSFSGKEPPKTGEARILHDADRLDALGAIGIARTFAVSGALGRELYCLNDPFAEDRSIDDSRYALDHWRAKLLNLPRNMATEEGRQLAKQRVSHMLVFLDAFADQIGSKVPEPWRSG